MKFDDEIDLSEWAFNYCLENDDSYIRSFITNDEDIFWYCKNVKNRKEMRDKISS